MGELEILDYLKNHVGDLLPLRGLSIHFETPVSKGKEWVPDFMARVSYKKVQFKLIGEIITQQSSSILMPDLIVNSSKVRLPSSKRRLAVSTPHRNSSQDPEQFILKESTTWNAKVIIWVLAR